VSSADTFPSLSPHLFPAIDFGGNHRRGAPTNLAEGTKRFFNIASTSESVLTARLRLISGMANTALCLGVSTGAGMPATVVNDAPSSPNPRRLPPISLPVLQINDDVSLLF
jgi:hypothetical protein